MKQHSQKKIIITTLLFLTLGFSTLYAQAVPQIETKKWDGGSSVSILFPEKYSGSVETRCVNNICTSTTTPFTEKDKKEMVKKMEQQRREMEMFWRKQQELFDQFWKQTISMWK